MRNKREHFCKGEFCQAKTYWLREGDEWVCSNCHRREAYRKTQPRASRIEGYQTPSQKKSIEYLRYYVEKNLDKDEDRADQITTFEIRVNDYDGSLWLTIKTELLGLPESNLLRLLSMDHWFFWIGRGGRIDAHAYPDSLKQFKGKRAFGFNVK